ncbi:hypothetical protein ACFY7Z_07085 [Streptomyces sp. NPDC012623]|uniref:hypothetical protein n=1 Tax=unclassified Streptomyces TaxID=2593676 RepID=UPI0036B3A5D5
MNMKRVFGLAAIVAGAVLAIFFADLEFGWFKGRPLGLILLVLGGIELLESTRRRKPKGLMEELREDFGIRSSRDRDRDRDRDRYRDDDRDRDRYREGDRDRYRDGDRDRDRYREDDRDRYREDDRDRDRYRDGDRDRDQDRDRYRD